MFSVGVYMIINDEVKKVIGKSAFLTLVTVNPDGTPHPIITGKGEAEGDNVVFGIYKMEKTQRNILKNNRAQVLGAVVEEGRPLGFRLNGSATVRESAVGKQLIFTADTIDTLI
jgi:predicted pyridoxine 5'-phosphate oxidase superfamily flavin-nucleotide-binding protein